MQAGPGDRRRGRQVRLFQAVTGGQVRKSNTERTKGADRQTSAPFSPVPVQPLHVLDRDFIAMAKSQRFFSFARRQGSGTRGQDGAGPALFRSSYAAFRSIVLRGNLKVGLRMGAGGADGGRFGSDDNVAAVAALPDFDFTLLKDLLGLHIL